MDLQESTNDYNIKIRNFLYSDFEDLKETMREAYPNIDDDWQRSDIKAILKIFPEGQLCIEVNEKVVACAFSLIVDYKKYGDNHTYDQVTGNGKFTTHDSKGDVLYGIEVLVHPDYQGMRLGRRLYDARKEVCENLNLRAIVAGGRIPGYRKYAEEFTPFQYVERVKAKELFDPILSFQISNDFHVKKILKNI